MFRRPDGPRSYKVGYIAGISRLGYNPRVTAAALWIAGDDSNAEIPESGFLEASKELLAPYADPEYVEKYLDRLLEHPGSSEEPQRTQRHVIEDAIIETEAVLRKFALRDLGMDSAQPTEAFFSHPKYKAGVKGLRKIEPMIWELDSIRVTTCPTCFLVGSIATWFGYRQVRGKTIPQSWCVVCRGIGHSRSLENRVQDLFGADSWFALSNWGKETGILTPWERRFAYTIGMALARGWELSKKQAVSAGRVAIKALEHGFKP